MELNLVAFDAERLGGRLDRHRLALSTAPDFRRVARGCHGRDAVQRLHLRVVRIVAEIRGLESRRSLWHLGAHVAELEPVCGLGIRIARGPGEGLETLFAVETPSLAVLAPSDGAFDFVPRCKPGPRSLGNNADTTRQRYAHNDTLDGQNLGFVKRFGLCTF